jgi:E3 ubiquitin-protein ligase SHPRH
VLQIEAVVRRVKHLTTSSDAKVLVFSTWPEVLQILSHALRDNGVCFAYAKTPQKLRQAISDLKMAAPQAARPNTKAIPATQRLQTILLPIKHGANGLNLTGLPHPSMCEDSHLNTRLVQHIC